MDDDLISAGRTGALTRIVLSLVPHWRAGEIGTFEYLSGGYSNENYRFRRGNDRFVLRVPERVRPFVDRELEAAFYRGRYAIRTAELVAIDTAAGFLITRFEPGALLVDSEVSIAQIADYLKSLHTALPSSGRCYDPVRMAREYLAVGSVPDRIRRLADDLIWQPVQTAPCHNDLNPWNVIVPDAGSWVTLDWEWIGDNDPLFDLVTLHQGLALGGSSLPGLAAACHGHPVDDEHLRRCLIAFWLREYAWAHSELHHGNRRREIEAQLASAATHLSGLQPATSSG